MDRPDRLGGQDDKGPPASRAGAGRILVLLAIMALISVGLTAALLANFASTVDHLAAAKSRAMVAGGLAYEEKTNANTIHEYGIWPDAAQHLGGAIDHKWAATNLATRTSNHVIDSSGRTLAAVGEHTAARLPLADAAPGGVVSLLERLPKTPRGARRMTTGVCVYDRLMATPAMLCAAPLLAQGPHRAALQSRMHYIVLSQPLSTGFLEELGAAYQLERLRWHAGDADADENSHAVKDASGAVIGHLAWDAERLSRNVMQATAPAVAAAILAFVVSGLLLSRLVVRTTRELVAQTQRAERALRRVDELSAAGETLRHAAETDPLTGLLNRRGFIPHLEPLLARAGVPVGLALIDIDYFKSVNDGFGHHIGDLVLQRIGRVLTELSPEGWVIGRLGGEEFAVGGPASGVHLEQFAEELRERLSEEEFSGILPQGRRVTASIGLADTTQTARTFRDLCIEADGALYDAKRAGRNRVRRAPPQPNSVQAA